MAPISIPALTAAKNIATMKGRSFSFVGAASLLRWHLAVTPGNRLSRESIVSIFKAKTPATLALLDQVMDLAFSEDQDGMIYSRAVDREARGEA